VPVVASVALIKPIKESPRRRRRKRKKRRMRHRKIPTRTSKNEIFKWHVK